MSIPLNNTVLADGCFDPLHVGHVAYLEAAARLGELVVLVATDDAIKDKGRESFQAREERIRTVRALHCVAGTVNEHSTLANAIRQLKPNVLAKGRDWIGRLPADVVAACREVGTVIVYTDTQERTSTERLKPAVWGAWPGGVVAPPIDSGFYRPAKFERGDPGDENDGRECYQCGGTGKVMNRDHVLVPCRFCKGKGTPLWKPAS